MGQGVGIGGDALGQNRRRATLDFGHGDVKHEHRNLKDIQADNFFDQVVMGDDDIKSSHHQHDDDPIIDQAN